MNLSEFEDAYEDEARIRGALLTTPLRELGLKEPALVDVKTSVVAAVRLMNERHTGCVLVGRDGRLAGIFTERDVIQKVAFHPEAEAVTVESVMTADPETLTPDVPVAWALNKMSVGGFRNVPVVDADGHPVGLVSVRDVVDFITELFPESVLNLPSGPEKAASAPDGG